jgi:hypothetical protein
MIRARYGGIAAAGCGGGALARAGGFVDSRIAPKPESRTLIETWAPARGIENHIVSATIEARNS